MNRATPPPLTSKYGIRAYIGNLIPILRYTSQVFTQKVIWVTILFIIGIESYTLPLATKYGSKLIHNYTRGSWYLWKEELAQIIAVATMLALIPFIRRMLTAELLNETVSRIKWAIVQQSKSHPTEYSKTELLSAIKRVSYALHAFIGLLLNRLLPLTGKIIALLLTPRIRAVIQTQYRSILILLLLLLTLFYLATQLALPQTQHAWAATDDATVQIKEALNQAHLRHCQPQTLRSTKRKINIERKAWRWHNLAQSTITLFKGVVVQIIGYYLLYQMIQMQSSDGIQGLLLEMKGNLLMLSGQTVGLIDSLRMMLNQSVALRKISIILEGLPTKKSDPTIPSEEEHPTSSPLFAIQNLHFSYKKEKTELLRNLNLTIQKGMRIALIGESGSGKSTLCDLLSGAIEPTKGRVTYKGKSLKRWDRRQLGESMLYISQQTPLIKGTIEENILYPLNKLAKQALQPIKKSLNYRMGEEGKGVSRGEKKSILLARALAAPVECLILDEPFAALDQSTAEAQWSLLQQHSATLIIATHRTDWLDHFDAIYQVKKGELLPLIDPTK